MTESTRFLLSGEQPPVDDNDPLSDWLTRRNLSSNGIFTNIYDEIDGKQPIAPSIASVGISGDWLDAAQIAGVPVYLWAGTSGSDPVAGEIKADSSDLSLITSIRINDSAINGIDIGFILNKIDEPNTLIMSRFISQLTFAGLEVTGPAVDNTTFHTIPVSVNSNNGSFVIGERLKLLLQPFAFSNVEDHITGEIDVTKYLAPDGSGGLEYKSHYIEDHVTQENDTGKYLAPDGSGGVEYKDFLPDSHYFEELTEDSTSNMYDTDPVTFLSDNATTLAADYDIIISFEAGASSANRCVEVGFFIDDVIVDQEYAKEPKTSDDNMYVTKFIRTNLSAANHTIKILYGRGGGSGANTVYIRNARVKLEEVR